MSETIHHALVCERHLLRALGDAGLRAMAQREDAPLREFWRRESAARGQPHSRVPLDVEKLSQALEGIRKVGASAPSAHPHVRALLDASRAITLAPRPISPAAQKKLFDLVARVEQLAEGEAAESSLLWEIARTRLAVDAFNSADLRGRFDKAAESEPHAHELVESCLVLCKVPGHDDDIGFGDLYAHTFLVGECLVPYPEAVAGEPSPELHARTVDRFGAYGPLEANELLLGDWLQFSSSFGSYVPATWAEGAALLQAASRVDLVTAEIMARLASYDAQRERAELLVVSLERFQEAVLAAIAGGHAIVEWLDKW